MKEDWLRFLAQLDVSAGVVWRGGARLKKHFMTLSAPTLSNCAYAHRMRIIVLSVKLSFTQEFGIFLGSKNSAAIIIIWFEIIGRKS